MIEADENLIRAAAAKLDVSPEKFLDVLKHMLGVASLAETPVVGWKSIAVLAAPLSIKQCRRLAERRHDPLPVLRFTCEQRPAEGPPVAYASALAAWMSRNMVPLQTARMLASASQEAGTFGTRGNPPRSMPRENKHDRGQHRALDRGRANG